MIVLVMGVSGCGKTVVGAALAEALGCPFLDGDDFHPPANVAKMASGTPLADADRWPWLDRLADEMRAILVRGGNAVVACSALKQAYRDRLARAASSPDDIRVVHLKADYTTIATRLATRKHRYMPATLLQSQFATLEEPAGAIVIDASASIADEVARICAQLDAQRVRA
jgi:gluconokinase